MMKLWLKLFTRRKLVRKLRCVRIVFPRVISSKQMIVMVQLSGVNIVKIIVIIGNVKVLKKKMRVLMSQPLRILKKLGFMLLTKHLRKIFKKWNNRNKIWRGWWRNSSRTWRNRRNFWRFS